MTDELVEENGGGVVQTAAISAEDSVDALEAAMSILGIDRRSAMPDDEECLEYRLRDAHDQLTSAAIELNEEGFGEDSAGRQRPNFGDE